jgi:outer membrane protein assembly factor BamB
MRRAALVATVALCTLAGADAQSPSAAVPPSPAQLDRLRLTTEWAVHVPMDGRTDTVTQVQMADADQLFVQTKAGNFLALDSRTGQRLWAFRFPNGRVESFPVATNAKHVFVANLSTLYCFHRFSGLLEFTFEPSIRLGIPLATITAGPVCDDAHVYVVLGNRNVLAYKLPNPVKQPDPAASKDASALGRAGMKVANPADQVAGRYPGKGLPGRQEMAETPSRGIPSAEININTKQVAPSVAVLPSVTPPYQIRDRNGLDILRAESLTAINSLRYPYRIHDAEGRYIVKSPSVTVIPPSVSRAMELNDIKPKGLEPSRQWLYEASGRLQFEPVLSGARLWLTFAAPRALAFDRLEMVRPERSVQTDGAFSAPAAAAMVADGGIGYAALADGSLVAVDLNYGGVNNMGALKQMWRANVGGPMNRPLTIAAKHVYVGGDASGIGRIDRKIGELDWRTAPEDDVLLAVNDESAYTRSSKGIVRVYDLNSPGDPITKQVVPVGEIALPAFGVPVSNTKTDRLILAADNGLIVALRDAAPKYATAKPTLPKAPPPAPKPEAKPADAAPMK